MAGLLIVFEGSEGAGKSTHVRRLTGLLERAGRDVVAVREPGGTPLGDEIRRLLLDPASDIEPAAEALLFMASRAQLVTSVIRPALARGAVVLVDRFFLSTYAYQAAGRGLPLEAITGANELAVGELVPDVTLLLHLPTEVGMARATLRGAADRMEQSGSSFHARVASAFARFAESDWQQAHPECGHIVLVDATGDAATVAARVDSLLNARWPETFPLGKGFEEAAPPEPRPAAQDAG